MTRALLLLSVLACTKLPPLDAQLGAETEHVIRSMPVGFVEDGKQKCWAVFEHDSHPLMVPPSECPFATGRAATVYVIAGTGYREVLHVDWQGL